MLGSLLDKRQKQSFLMLNENRHITKGKHPVDGDVLTSSKQLKSWFLLRDFLERAKGIKGFTLVLDCRGAIPMSPYLELNKSQIDSLTDLDDLASQGEQDEISRVDKRKDENRLASVLDFGIIALMIIVAIAAMLMIGGKVDFGQFMGNITGGP